MWTTALWLLVVCVGVTMAAPHKTVFESWKTVSVPATKTVSVSHDPVSPPQTTHTSSQEVVGASQGTVHVPLKTKSVVVSPPRRSEVVVVKTHDHAASSQAFRNSETYAALDSAGSQLASALGSVATNLGTFLSTLLNSAANVRKQVVVHQQPRKVVVHQPPPPPRPAHDDNQGLVYVKTKTVF